MNEEQSRSLVKQYIAFIGLLGLLGCRSTAPLKDSDPYFQKQRYKAVTENYTIEIIDLTRNNHMIREVMLRARRTNIRPYEIIGIDDNADGSFESYNIVSGAYENDCIASVLSTIANKEQCSAILLNAARPLVEQASKFAVPEYRVE
jgi:hypothetical protein